MKEMNLENKFELRKRSKYGILNAFKITIWAATLITITLLFTTKTMAAELIVDTHINPKGIISDSYNVVGDIFTYKINVTNPTNEIANETFTVNLVFPNNREIQKNPINFSFTLIPNETIELIPYINRPKTNDTYIWPFDQEGDYELRICSPNFDTKLTREYIKKGPGSVLYRGNYFYHKCFSHYFTAMPEWQYKLFQEESAAAKKVEEANQKLLDLNIRLEDATQSMKYASWFMTVVAAVTLWVTLSNKKEEQG